MVQAQTANDIAVSDVLEKFESDFALTANAIANGEFALWVGSGISRQAPNLGSLIERAFDYIRERAVEIGTADTYLPALEEALGLAGIEPSKVQAQYLQPLMSWPEYKMIIERLWNKYARVLDIRIPGTESDFMLWDAVSIRLAFQNPAPPAAEHLCIAILILEGVVQSVASANWDGFIETAVDRLSNSAPGVLQVVVDPFQLREPPGRAQLLKFHGCIVHASQEPSLYRRFLTGSYTQIMDWPEKPELLAMRNAVVGLATAQKTLVLGLSIQDSNLQSLFARAKAAQAWPWPCAPDAPAHIFCEDMIQQGQRDLLRLTYGDAYNENVAAIHDATLLRAWGEKVLIALVLKVLGDKLITLMQLALIDIGKGPVANDLESFLKTLRDDIAKLAVPTPITQDRTDVVNQAITLWSRMLSMFRSGCLPQNTDAYETLSSSKISLIANDQNAKAMGLGRLGVALSLLQYGCTTGLWVIHKPVDEDLKSGVITASALRPDGKSRPVFIVKSATEAIILKKEGGLVDGAIILHADEAWYQMCGGAASARRVSSAPGRTGHIGETHVSLGNLITNCGDAVTLQQEFVKEMML